MSSVSKVWHRVTRSLSHSSLGNSSSVFKPRKGNRQLRLPVELFRLVIEHVSWTPDLYSLLFVSRIVRAEAERVLYMRITLGTQIHDGFSYNGRHSSLFKTLQSNDRVAYHVLHLDLWIRSHQPHGPPTTYWASLHHTLTRLPNLHTLVLRLELDSPFHGPSVPLFKGCTFQLRTLSMIGATVTNTGIICLQEQTKIEDLALGLTENAEFDVDICFPKLKVLVASDASRTNALLERESLRAVHLLEKCTQLRDSARANISSLRMASSYTNQLPILMSFPSLRYLRIDNLLLPTPEFARGHLVCLKHLLHLQKLHLDIASSVSFSYDAPLDLDDLAQDMFVNVSPSLHVLVIGYGMPPYQEWLRWSGGYEYVSADENEWKCSRWWNVPNQRDIRSPLFY